MEKIFDNVKYIEEERIGYLYLTAKHGNKMTKNFLQELAYVCKEVILKADIDGLIILGKGRHFSSGADVDQLIEGIGKEKSPSWFVDVKEIFGAFADMKIPIITGVSGFCIGSGLEFALAGNIRICERGSTIGFPESTFGLLPGATGTYRSTELVGMSNSMELVLSGEFIDAQKAVELGLFHKVCDKKTILETCKKVMQEVLKKID